MTFSRAKPTGWATGERLTSAQMNTVDTNQSRAVDGNAGGTYTPSSAITINGSGLTVNTFVSSATATCNGTAQFNGTSTFDAPVVINDALTIAEPLDAHDGDFPFLRLKRLQKSSGGTHTISAGQFVILSTGVPSTVIITDDTDEGGFVLFHNSTAGSIDIDDTGGTIVSIGVGETAILVSGSSGTWGLFRKW